MEVFSEEKSKTVISDSHPPVFAGHGTNYLGTRKFMQTLDNRLYLELEKIAKQRGITVQQLLRAVVVPEWFQTENPEKSREIYRSPGRVRNRRRPRKLSPKLIA